MTANPLIFYNPDVTPFYGPNLCGPSTLGAAALAPQSLAAVLAVLEVLEPDDYSVFLSAYLREGMRRYGEFWRYADICTVCLAAATLLKPRTYLEIGVRRGRSMAMAASAAPDCDLTGFDLWIENYAGMDNPGKELVERELDKLGHRGKRRFIDGDSHVTLKAYFLEHPEAAFDLVVVDGDHTDQGAAEDLRDVLPHVALGGVLVFDDIAHPAHPYLDGVWRDALAADGRFRDWRFEELGFGVALAVRMA